MKKIIAILLLLFILTFAVACGDDPINTETNGGNINTDTQIDTETDTDTSVSTDTDTDTDSSTDSGDGQDLNDILGPDWTLPQK
ncbi:MAG: hypothetical protein II984_07255 [Clostridia bacterium]|nr:hypothetical protein [Clostridia bacterium]